MEYKEFIIKAVNALENEKYIKYLYQLIKTFSGGVCTEKE